MIEDFIYQILYGISVPLVVLLCTQYSVYFPSKYSQYMTIDQWPSIITFDINLVWKYCVVEPTDAHNNVCFFEEQSCCQMKLATMALMSSSIVSICMAEGTFLFSLFLAPNK